MERVWEEVVITIWGNILAEYYKIKRSVLWKTTSEEKRLFSSLHLREVQTNRNVESKVCVAASYAQNCFINEITENKLQALSRHSINKNVSVEKKAN